MKHKKHQFHCAKCNSIIEIFKKGKKHRVMVCPNCGVIAVNPFSVVNAIKGIAKSNPISGAIVGALEGFDSPTTPTKTMSTPQHQIPKHHYKTYVDKLIEHELKI